MAGSSCGGAALEHAWRFLCQSGAWARRRVVEGLRCFDFWTQKVIHDPDMFKEYEYQRIHETLHAYRKLNFFVTMFVCAVEFVMWIHYARPLDRVVVDISPFLINGLILAYCKSNLKVNSPRTFRLRWVALNVCMIVVPSCHHLATAHANPDRPVQFHPVFLVRVFFGSCVGYIPSRDFYTVCCPLIALLWVGANVSSGVVSAVVSGLGITCVISWARGTVDTVNQRTFLLTRELEQARKSLEHVLSAQQSVFGTIFDALGACDAEGGIVQSTPQMLEMFESSNLLRTSLASLAASPEEERRLQEFLGTAWSSGVGRATMIQARLRRGANDGAGAPCASPTACPRQRDALFGGTFEARIVCVRLPGTGVAAQPEKLWAHNGLFLGLQKVGEERFAEAPAGQAQSAGAGELALTPGGSTVLCPGPERAGQPRGALSDHAFDFGTECSFAVSKTTSSSRRRGPLTRTVAVQTGLARPPAMPEPLDAAAAEAPPRRRAGRLSAEPGSGAAGTAKPCRGRQPARLGSSTRQVPEFEATPRSTMAMRLRDAMAGINAGGRGCCVLHVSVAAARRALDAIDRQACDTLQFGSRQCPKCLALIDPEAGEEGADGGTAQECETCGELIWPRLPKGSLTLAASDAAPPTALERTRCSGASMFKVTLDRSGGAKLGISVDFGEGSAVLVEEVGEGLVEQWNSLNEGSEIRFGDYLIEVNGVAGSSARILAECSENKLLEIVVLRHKGPGSSSGASSTAPRACP